MVKFSIKHNKEQFAVEIGLTEAAQRFMNGLCPLQTKKWFENNSNCNLCMLFEHHNMYRIDAMVLLLDYNRLTR